MEQKDIVVVLIGSTRSEKDGKITPIPNVRKNIDELRQVFTDPLIAGVPDENIYPILDCSRQDSIEQLYRICRAVTCEKLLLVYYAGHGILGDDAQLYLAAADSQLEMIMISGIRAGDVANLLKGSRARRKVLILDSCYSGAIMGVMSAAISDTMTAEMNREDYRGVYAMAAVSDMEQARFDVNNPDVPTYFTGALIDALNNGMATGNDRLSIDELYHEVRERLISKGLPRPVRKMSEDAGLFMIAYNKQYKPKVKSELSDDELAQLGDMLLHAGNTKFENGDLEGALTDFRKAQRLLPDRQDIPATIGRCQAVLDAKKSYAALIADAANAYQLRLYEKASKIYESAAALGNAANLDTRESTRGIQHCLTTIKAAANALRQTQQHTDEDLQVPEVEVLSSTVGGQKEFTAAQEEASSQVFKDARGHEPNSPGSKKQYQIIGIILAASTIIISLVLITKKINNGPKPLKAKTEDADSANVGTVDSNRKVSAAVSALRAVDGNKDIQLPPTAWVDSVKKVIALKYKWGYGTGNEPTQLRYMKALYALGKYYETEWELGLTKDNSKAMSCYMKILALKSGTDSDLSENEEAISYRDGVANEVAKIYMEKYDQGNITKQQLADWLARYAPGYQSREQLSKFMFNSTDQTFIESDVTNLKGDIVVYINPYVNGSARIDGKLQSGLTRMADLMQKYPSSKAKVGWYITTDGAYTERGWDRSNAIIEYLSEKFGIDRNRIIYGQGVSSKKYNGLLVSYITVTFPCNDCASN